jgi:hypothetical protein
MTVKPVLNPVRWRRSGPARATRRDRQEFAAQDGSSWVSNEIQSRNVLVPGQRPDSETISGTINMLCSDRYTDIGEGATYQSTWLAVAAWPEPPP